MHPLVEPAPFNGGALAAAHGLIGEPGVALLGGGGGFGGRFSLLAARPVVRIRAWGSRIETATADGRRVQFGDPWRCIQAWMERFETPSAPDWPFPLGCCAGFLGYDLKNWVEPGLPRRRSGDLGLPDCDLGFYSSLTVWDHALGRAWTVACGLAPDGARSRGRARAELAAWRERLQRPGSILPPSGRAPAPGRPGPSPDAAADSFVNGVRRALEWIRAGHIYQVNLARRLSAPCPRGGWALFRAMDAVSPAPCAAYLDGGDYALASASPETFLHWHGRHVVTRPIKGTRPRSADPQADASLARELDASEKERAELLMITDLLRNDLGRVCEYGSVRVSEIARVESFAQVHHRTATIEGLLRPGVTPLEAVRQAFPGGSVTGAPKVRAMEIIDELESASRGPYCGVHGCLGFNQTGILAVTIRTAVLRRGRAWFHTGAGIVADSDPEGEWAETEAKAAGWRAALSLLEGEARAEESRTPESVS